MTLDDDLSLAEREVAYSPSSCIGGNYAPFIRQYAERSAAALQAGLPVQRGLRYGPGPAHQLDLFLPPAAARPPALLVFIHGGYWQELSRQESLFAAPGCLAAGHAFAALDYTLAPHARVEDIARECRQALRWLHANAATLGFDPARIVVAGSSAGGHLTAMACLRGWPGDDDLPQGVPAAALPVSGVFDLAPLIGTSIDKALSLDLQQARHVSPLHQPLAGFPPAVVAWGDIETEAFKRQSRAFAAALPTPAPCIEVPRRNHFDVILDLCEAGTPLGDACLDLLRRTAD